MDSIDPIYEELRKKIDESMPVGFPASEEGTELRLLQMIFTPEEAKIAINLGALPEPLKRIHRRVKKAGIEISISELEKILDGIVEKGGIMGGALLYDKEKDIKNYSLAQWAVGIFEFQLDKMTKEFAKLAHEYSMGTFYKEGIRKDTPPQLHTIPVEKSLTPENYVSTYDNIRDIVMDKVEKIALRDCVCRQEHDILEDPCKKSDIRRCCVMFNSFAIATIENGTAKEVTKEEFFDLLDEYQKAGFVLQPQNNQNPVYMCVCCGCCCGLLLMVKQYPNPAEYYHSNFYAQSDPELCNGCETCLDQCPMDAITMIDQKSNVNLDRCIGCGNCAAICEVGAMKLIKREEEAVPAKDMNEMYQKILEKKIAYLQH